MGRRNKNISSLVENRRKKNKSSKNTAIHKNPFEVRLNNLKHDVVGKVVKTNKGVPGIARSRAIEKRKKTLLKEYKRRFKNNVIVDKRIGEYDESISTEEKMLKRFTLEKKKRHEKSSLYKLDNDDELTHYGQSLSTLDNFDDAGLKFSDDEDDQNYDKTSDHFGGFLQKKNNIDESDNLLDKKKQTKQDIMDEIVANAKKKKFERQQVKEEAFVLTQKLDAEWKDVHDLLISRNIKEEKKKEIDDYDKTVNQLIFEARAQASERMKSEEEIAREEKEKRERLEKERRKRMLGIEEEIEEHISVDAIVQSKKKKDKRYEVRYKDGKMVLPEGEEDLFGLAGLAQTSNDSDEPDDDEDDNHDADHDSDDGDSGSENEVSDNADIVSDDESENIETIDIISSDDGDENVVAKTQAKNGNKKNASKKTSNIPFTFQAPDTLEDLLNYCVERNNDEILLILSRIRKCHHIKLHQSNRQKLENLLDLTLQYIEHICKEDKPRLKLVNSLARFIYELSEDVSQFSAQLFQKKIKKIEKNIFHRTQLKGSSGMFPSLNELVFLKVVALVYPTSDLNHCITTPCLYLMATIMAKAHLSTIKDVVSGLFLLNVFLDYISLSKRYAPEIITFISKLLYQCADTNKPLNKISGGVLNLRKNEKNLLLIERSCSHQNSAKPLNIGKLLSKNTQPVDIDNEETRLSCINNMFCLIENVCDMYKHLQTYSEIIQPCFYLMERLPVDLYPMYIQNFHKSILKSMNSSKHKKRERLTLQARKPIPLPLLEPAFDENYEIRSKKRVKDRQKNEIERMKYKIKKETKGAIREIRKDAHFIAKEQLKETLEKDASRQKKVKDLEQALANERHEIKQMEKSIRKKK